ncbi:MAG: TolC family protein [Myxococcales bacterium]|nr:TolC family protein [Myxococcales bacterium]
MTTLSRLARVLGSGVIVAGLAAHASADVAAADAAPGGLVLDQVVQVTLSASPELKLAATEVEIASGELTVSRAAFELKLTTAATASRTSPLDANGARAVQQDFLVTAGAQRLLRNGVLATSEVSLTRSLLSRSLGADTAKADVRLGVSIPLLRDRGGASSAAAEQAAARDHEAARWGLRHAAAQQVLAAVAAYWDYQAAHRRLEVLRASEARAERAVEETRALVQADERTPADLIQLQGNAASKRATRASAEQGIVAARTALGLAMGLPADAIATLPPPATAFPKPASGAARLDAGLVADTYRRRADLAAAEQRTRSASIRLEAARSDQRPRLDLLLNTGYRASDAESLDEPRVDALVELRLELPLSNSAARGQVMQSSAAQQQRHLAHDDLRRRIAADVAMAVEAVTHAEATMLESAEAVHLFETGIQAVQRKFQLGGATLFDLIQAQDALTNALLFDVESQRDHAVAIAVLSFQSGRLVEGDRDNFRVPVADLVRAP